MNAVLDWLQKNHGALVRSLADLVAIQSISTDGEHQKEIDQTAALTCEQMRQAGLQSDNPDELIGLWELVLNASVFSLGHILLGVAIFRADVLPRAAGVGGGPD